MKGLIERIKVVRAKIDTLVRERNAIKNKIENKKAVLEELEKLAVNQLDLFEE